MKKIYVKYEDALAEIDTDSIKEQTLGEKIVSKFSVRLPQGRFFNTFKESRRLHKSAKTKESGLCKKYYTRRMLLGKGITERISPSLTQTAEEINEQLSKYMIPYRPKKYLYHYAPEECLESIKKNGLLPKEKFVFMTNYPELLKWFPSFKTRKFGRDSSFVLLKIDARRAAKEHNFYYYHLDQIVADRIKPEYIIFD